MLKHKELKRNQLYKIIILSYFIFMANIILELSNQKANTLINNGDFETTLHEPITINNNDIIQIKNVFLDTVQQNYQQIYLPEDVTITLTFCFYEIDVPVPSKSYLENHPGQADYGMYLCFRKDAGGFNYDLVTSNVTKTIPKGLYTPDSLAITITKLLTNLDTVWGFPQSPFIFPVDSTYYFCNIQNTNTVDYNTLYHYITGGQQNWPILWTGARQVALVYNDQNDNKFSWQYLHTPLYDDNGNVSIKFLSQTMTLGIATREAGVAFIDLQPRDFWQSLGFDVDGMTIKFNRLTTNPVLLSFNNKQMTTEQFVSIDDLFGHKFDNTANNSQYARQRIFNTKQSTYTRSLSAGQFYSFKNLSPFLLVELLTNFNGSYLTSGEKNKFISGIVPRNYTQNNYITGYEDSGIQYIHKGESFLLSSIRTRILDPSTKDIPIDIGPNNYIIINVIKNS